MRSITLIVFLLLANASPAATQEGAIPRKELQQQFASPPVDCWPRTRWWWMGNAMTKDDIEWQLRQMKDHGIGGVEQITMEEVYERGNFAYLSPQYLEQIKHMVSVAKSLDMSVSFNFGGPGWVFGGDWIPPDDQNQCLISSALEVDGPASLTEPLSLAVTINPLDVPRSVRQVGPEDRLLAVVAGRVEDGKLSSASLVDITANASGRTIAWQVPEGHWRIMAFWLTRVEDGVVDHLNRAAMERYFDHVGAFYEEAVGEAFGSTVESFFSDSFEVPIHRNAFYWNEGLLPRFREVMGYDLTPYLPAVWWQVDDISPKIRYDVNAFLDRAGFESFFEPFLNWCERHNVKGRIQPYGFPTDNIEGAGRAHIPEMEITAGEKDCVPWFDTRIGPRAYVASGAHLYGRNIVSVEAYTYLHWELYRETLEELKIAGDVFLQSGANLFYNSGYLGTPERSFAPSRDFNAAIHVDHTNIWWPYYPELSRYVARSCRLLREGNPVADIAVYSPLANQWTENCLNARRWTRDFQWGSLGELLWANGYAFDLLNDNVLQNRAEFDGQELRIDANRYRLLILPNLHSLPLRTLERIRDYVAQGGIVVALERVPETSTGFRDWQTQDAKLREIVGDLFASSEKQDGHEFGKGRTYLVCHVLDRTDPLDKRSSVFDPFVNTLRKHVAPDMGIDFVREEMRENEGLLFNHRASDDRDIYFVANVQDRPVNMPVTFRVAGSTPYRWNPCDGSVGRIWVYKSLPGATEVPLRLGPYESTFLVFEREEDTTHALYSSFDSVENITGGLAQAWTSSNGMHTLQLAAEPEPRRVQVDGVPAPWTVDGVWTMVLEAPGFPLVKKDVMQLESWTAHKDTEHFSGTGTYSINFTLADAYANDDMRLWLDLGQVGNVAEVSLNGKPVGVRWYRGQRLDVTTAAQKGDNALVIRVTNTLINAITGLDRMPPVPDELAVRLGQGLHDTDSSTLSLLNFKPLPVSGLIGPVRIIPEKCVRVTGSNTAQKSR
ncbi:MAG: hypothetical protein K1Y02_18000 [Candidatus Hydrogenedentes bacterium]|nr:hypothetical protein [Candidatus Hydrogenedentota bacterium]